jgi:hypothetical protein
MARLAALRSEDALYASEPAATPLSEEAASQDLTVANEPPGEQAHEALADIPHVAAGMQDNILQTFHREPKRRLPWTFRKTSCRFPWPNRRLPR